MVDDHYRFRLTWRTFRGFCERIIEGRIDRLGAGAQLLARDFGPAERVQPVYVRAPDADRALA